MGASSPEPLRSATDCPGVWVWGCVGVCGDDTDVAFAAYQGATIRSLVNPRPGKETDNTHSVSANFRLLLRSQFLLY